ncbi:MAG: bifunctional phosphopantothenoylcysteine decarboxylase/phosphopantothenate--cysteine ligase CoaBC [Bacteroidota bacterium]
MLSGKKIILGVSGSIAAYKAILLLRLLQKEGAEVKVVLTPAVSKFVGELSFSALTNGEVLSDLWEGGWSDHVALGTWADLMIVAPATANTLAKMSHGICDNALLAVYLAARCPVMVAPAMDADMYIHPRTAANLHSLAEDGVMPLPVGSGFLASGLIGPGRLLEPEEIVGEIKDHFARMAYQPLQGQAVLITAGPTREPLDPVRFITNHSSGKMGYALAAQAASLGAKVTLVSGPTQLAMPAQVERVDVSTAQEMYEAVHAVAAQQQIIIMSAAVADYTPAQVAHQKIKKKGDDLSLELIRTKDILKSVGETKQAHQFLVGFAMETENGIENAQRKLEKKNLDLIVLNSLRDKGAGFGHDTNKVTLIERNGAITEHPLMSKSAVAKEIFKQILAHWKPINP